MVELSNAAEVLNVARLLLGRNARVSIRGQKERLRQ